MPVRRVFISHSWDHPDQHARVTDLLDRHGYEYFDHSITRDSPLPISSEPALRAQLADRIGRVSSVLVMATDDVHKKPLVNFEVAEALRQRKRVVAVKPWGTATGPVPRVLHQFANAIVGFRGDQIVPALDGDDVRNLSQYLISETEDLVNLAHWVVRGTAGVVILGSITTRHWLPPLNRLLQRRLGVRLVWKTPPPTLGEVVDSAVKAGLIGLGIGLLFGDARLAATFAAVGGAIGAGSTIAKAMSLHVIEGREGFEARYLPIPL